MIDFDAPFVLPVFPLTGTLLLPGTLLPLNVFEARYRHLVSDVLKEDSLLGLVQPLDPSLDNFGQVDDPNDPPTLQSIGCVGQIDRSELQSDGRYQILVRGLVRFRTIGEAEVVRGYRRFRVDCEDFLGDPDEIDAYRNPKRVLVALEAFGKKHELEFDFDSLVNLSGVTLVNALSSALPFSPLEKQALLEAPDIEQREQVMLTLMGMAPDDLSRPEDYFSAPVVN